MSLLSSARRPRAPRISRNLKTPGKQIWQHFDVVLLASTVMLMIIGIAMIRSTTLGNIELNGLEFVQIRWGVIGLVVMLVATAVDYRYYRPFATWLYVFVLVWLGLIFVLGLTSFGAQRWLDFFGLFNIQPSEMAKIGSIIWVARYFADRKEEAKTLRTIILSLVYSGVPIFLVLAQPDLSSSIMLGIVWLSIAWAAGLRLQHVALGAGLGVAALPVLWFAMADYQRLRVLQFINPALDPGAQYNIDQALISIGSGGLFGEGYNSASQVQFRFLKVRHTDFIFAATSAEFGLIGAVVIIVLLGVMIWRILRIARMAGDPFGAYICYGLAGLTFAQSVINVGMNMNLMPVTGLPLPFVSYGGSALLTFFAAVGVAQSVALRHKVVEF